MKRTIGTGFVVLGTVSPVSAETSGKEVRLGGPVKAEDPESWIKELKDRGYRAAYCPVGANADEMLVKAYAAAAKANDIIIAEVGAWSNPMDTDGKKAKKALNYCIEQLALADRIGANCCVNISGSRGEPWDGHHPKNLTEETFGMIVEVTRKIIDGAKPARTYFTLETMPWMYPDSADSYLRLIKAVDRKRFAAHLDPVNLVCSPRLYYNNGKLIRECFEKLGPYIKSCHAKDITLEKEFMTHLSEIRAGLGGLDYRVFLREVSKIGDLPLMLEHLKRDSEYRLAARYIRAIGRSIGLEL